MSLFIPAFSTINNGNGDPRTTAQIAFFDFGTTTLSTEVFSDSDLTVQLTNPVLLTSVGNQPEIYLANQFYMVQLQDAGGTPIQEISKYQGTGTDAGRGTHDWSPTVTYQFNDLVEDQEKYYFSLKNDNIGNTPTTAEDDPNWRIANFHSEYNSTIDYAVDALVTKNGLFFRSRVTPNLDNDPDDSPDFWSNMSGLGLQTVNIDSTGFIPPGTNGAEKSTKTIGAVALVPVAAFDSATNETVQFSFLMPASYDNTQTLQARITYYPSATATGFARLIVTAYGLGDAELGTAINFGSTTLGVDLDGLVVNTQYISEPFDVNEVNALAPNSMVYFQLLDDTDAGTYDVDIWIKEIAIYYNTRSSVDDAQT